MQKGYETLREFLKEVDPPAALYTSVMLRIEALERRHARMGLVLFGLVAFLSGITLVPVVQYTLEQFQTSGFYDYAALLVSTGALGYWRELSLSLLESLPSVALLLVIPTAAALVWSLIRTVRLARAAFV